jgi:teichuronic acid exporter
MESLTEKATRGILWSSVERFAAQGAGFLIGIILARVLAPSDYGVIGMLTIFLAIAQTVVDSGFSSALVQKKDRTEFDLSTVFYFNLGVSSLIYVVLFVASGWIAAFYEVPSLELITKVIALNFVISAFSLVHRTKLLIDVDFKSQTKVSVISIVVSGALGIALAYGGFGVWALIVQSLAASVCETVLFWVLTKWKPLFVFSKESFRRLFSFGSKMLASSLLNTVYANIYLIVIGKVFSSSDLGYYTRAKQLEELPTMNMTNILQRVTFPIFCSIQDDDQRLILAYRRLIRLASFVIVPMMFLLATIAKPLIVVLITEKWLPAVDLFRILCFAGMWYPLHAINLNILQAKGRSDLFLKLEAWKKGLITVVLVVTIPFGLNVMMLGQAFTSFASLFLNTYYTGKYFDYGIAKQLKDIYMFLLLALVMFGIATVSIQPFNSNLLQLAVGSLVFAGGYVGLSILFRFNELREVRSVLLMPFAKASLETNF